MRFPLAARLTVILTAVVVLTLAAAALMQDRALVRGLHDTAADRLSRSALTIEGLASDHLRDQVLRYAALARSGELRASFEMDETGTLDGLARWVASLAPGSRVVLTDPSWKPLARAGGDKRGGSVLAAWQTLRKVDDPMAACVGTDARTGFTRCRFDAEMRAQSTLQQIGGRPQLLVIAPVFSGPRRVGLLLAAEPLPADLLAGWSELVGASVTLVEPGVASSDALVRVAHAFPDLDLRVSSSMRPELATLAETRRHGALAGLVALSIALYVSAMSARDFLRPIRQIRWAAEQLGRGDLEVRLRSRRSDEIGDVARVLDETFDRLRSSQQRLRNVQRIAQFADWSADPARGVVEGSPQFENLLGLSASPGERPLGDFLFCCVGADREKLEDRLRRCAHDGTPIELDLRVSVRSRERILHLRARRIEDEEGAKRIEGSVQDISDRRRAEEQIRFLAYHDSLTGLPNRRYMNERLALALAPMQRQPFALLFLDLDRFKLVNDTLGHSAGDELVRQVADRLTRIVSDHPGAAVARFGGDEFALYLPGLSEEPEIAEVVNAICRAVAAPVVLQGNEMTITASIGIARWPIDGETIEAVLRSCDTALHRAKENGRNCFCLYDSTMEEEANQRWRLENRLRRAVESMAFDVYYQPRVRARDGALVGFEALLRWQDPEFGGYAPAEFIPIAEETGLIVSVGDWVLRTVLRQLRSWLDEGLSIECMSVNVSGRQLTRELADRVRSALAEAGVEPSRLEIEVTESAVIDDAEAGVAALAELRALGVRLSLDDFGTGYSSLSYLRSLPITGVKIDRSFSSALGEDGRNSELVASIVSMAKVLGLSVIAEGVETEEQAELLVEMGCDELQGFLFGEPMPVVDARLRLVEGARAKRRAASLRS